MNWRSSLEQWHLKRVKENLNITEDYYCTSGTAVQEKIWFKAGSIGLTVGRANTEAENRIFSCIARPKECDKIFII